MFQRFGCDYDLERIGLARTIIHRTFGRFGMHGADHDPPLEGEWPFLNRTRPTYGVLGFGEESVLRAC
jgi:hypothetical protein